MKRALAAVIASAILFILLVLQVYDVIRLNGIQSMLITAGVGVLFHLYVHYTREPPRPRVPVDLAVVARLIELRDGVKRKIRRTAGMAAGQVLLDIRLIDPGPRKIKTIKRFRQLYDIGIANAAAVVDAAPVVIRAGASRAEADYVADYLAHAGAKVDVTG